ncbi:MAG: hypothetical protein Q8N14_00895 [Candidatus Omnitrophota bacterium]|nr:hypothetical protein [Candidatus Omnitrophota bacterium]
MREIIIIRSRPQNRAIYGAPACRQGRDEAWPLSINFRQTPAFRPEKLIFLTAMIIAMLNIAPTAYVEAENKGFELDPVSMKDPFLPLFPKKETEPKKVTEVASQRKEEVRPPELIIQGLVWGKIMPQAIVNNKVVTIGDIINEAKIVDINKNGVSILFKDKIFFVKPLTVEEAQKK